jgi:hypothetical protein
MIHIHDPKHRASSFTKAQKVVIHIFTLSQFQIDVPIPGFVEMVTLINQSLTASSATCLTDKTGTLGSITIFALADCKLGVVL